MQIIKINEELQIVYAEVYIPLIPDSDNDYMTAETIRKMAHKFLSSNKTNNVDVNHDRDIISASVVESFIARKGDSDFIEESWVVGIHIVDPDVWTLVKSGELNGFSLDGSGKGRDTELEVDIPDFVKGETTINEGHKHEFQVFFNDGIFAGGKTINDEGHSHRITMGTLTDATDNHAHCFNIVEEYITNG